MVTQEQSSRILDAVDRSASHGFELRALAMQLLSELPEYHWSGIYRLEGDTLHLDAYVGAATDHTEIPVGRGVCGTAVAENKNQVVTDVRALSNYLACSVETRSEIVVLVHSQSGSILGQIDIDGHTVGAFDATDEALLQGIAAILADRWED